MKINIKTTSLDLTPAITDYVNKKIKDLEKFIDPNDESAVANVDIGRTTEHHKSGDVYKTEVNIHIAGKDFRMEYVEEDLYASIDGAKDALSRDLSAYKGKKQTMERKGGSIIKRILKGFGK